MPRKNSIQRFCEQFGVFHGEVPAGGFITPWGHIVITYGNHEAMAQKVRTTLKNLIQAGMVRYVVHGRRYGTSAGIDTPKNVSKQQIEVILQVLRHHRPTVLAINKGGKVKLFGDTYGKRFSPAKVREFLERGR